MPRYTPEDSLQSPRFTGPSTFARLPYVRTLDEVDLAVVGVPFDTGRDLPRRRPVRAERRPGGVGDAPARTTRTSTSSRSTSCRASTTATSRSCPGYTERSYAAIEAAVEPIVEAGVVPLLIGGDHACTLPHLRATRSRGPVAVIDFDSHTDAWDAYFGEKYNHGTWMRRAIEEGLVDVDHSIEVGLRGSLYDSGDWSGLTDELGLDYLTTEDVFRLGPPRPSPRRSASASAIGRRSSASTSTSSIRRYAPGTGTPEAGGPSAHDLLAILRGLTGIDFVGFDVVEVIPAYDPAGQTATLAANLAYEMLSLVALRRAGR